MEIPNPGTARGNRRKYRLACLCLSCLLLQGLLSNDLKSQTKKIDSLREVLPSLNGIQRIDCLNELGFEFSNPFWSVSKYVRTDSARLFTEQALQESEKFQYAGGKGKAYQNLGMIEEEYGNFRGSEYYTRLAIPLLQRSGFLPEWHRAQINLAYCLTSQGYFPEALTICFSELPYYQAIGDITHVAMIYRMAARTYDRQGYKEKAFDYFQRNLEIENQATDLMSSLFVSELKTILYLKAGDTAKAIHSLKQSAILADRQHMRPGKQYPYLTEICLHKRNYDSALYFAQKTLDLINHSGTDSLFRKRARMIFSLSLAQIYLLKKDYAAVIQQSTEPLQSFAEGNDRVNWLTMKSMATRALYESSRDAEALSAAHELLLAAKHYQARPVIQDAYELLWKIHAKKKDLDKSYAYHVLYTNLKDSLQKDIYASRLVALEMLSGERLKEANVRNSLQMQNLRNEAKLAAAEKNRRVQFYVSSFLLLIGLVILYLIRRNYRLTRRKEELLKSIGEQDIAIEKSRMEIELAELRLQKSELQVQALRARMNPHFISNSLTAINYLIQNNERALASTYLTRFSRLVRHILMNSGSTFIPLRSELEALRLYLDMEALRFNHHFSYEIAVDQSLDTLHLNIQPLLIQPYVENAIWHGLMPKPEKGMLKITLYKDKDRLVCKIKDDGIGRKSSGISQKRSGSEHISVGMQITSDRIALLEKTESDQETVLVHDIVLADGKPGGTEVILKLKISHD
jgi:tetratricopeptide (TPR) repeat protein